MPGTLVDEGDVIDLGDRVFEVLHLPGHSPGSIGLWEESTGTLFSGDAVYDGQLLPCRGATSATTGRRWNACSNCPSVSCTAGHDPSFGRERLREIAQAYLDGLTEGERS